MNKLDNNFSELNVEDLQSIDGGRRRAKSGWDFVPYVGTAIAIYDAVTDFGKGFAKGMTDPE